jgi:hypothetical protein
MTRMLIVLSALLTMIGLSSAQAEEPTVITLSCDGTTKVYAKSDESINPVTKMGVVVNLAERTVFFDGRVGIQLICEGVALSSLAWQVRRSA